MNKQIMVFVFLGLLFGVGIKLQPESGQTGKPGSRTSPSYTVMVSLEMASQYVPDGRMSFADLAFSATFKNVVFHSDPVRGAWISEKHDGKILLTRYVFNDVYDGAERHKPWIEKAWPSEFSASLLSGWSEKDDDEMMDEDGLPIAPLVKETVRIGFLARFGLLDLEWISKLGSNVLSNMLFEFQAPLKPLLEGKPLTLNFHFAGDYPEDRGKWWVEFIPVGAKKRP